MTRAHDQETPEWRGLIEDSDQWQWRARRLFHSDALDASSPEEPRHWARRALLYLYADHNRSPAVRRAIAGMIEDLGSDEWGLNLGAGATRLHPRLLNLDIADRDNVDVVTRGQRLPFRDGSLKIVVSQEVLEHLPDPGLTIAEVHRVLAPGGRFYCQIPFIIGYHPGPHDYWRFTREGLQQLFDGPRWSIDQLELTLGHGSGFYRIAVEYVAVTAGALHRTLYLPAKGLGAVMLLPLKLPDLVTHRSSQRDRIPGGYYCIASKR